RVPLDLELPDVGGRLVQRRPGVLAGTVSFGPGPARFGSAPPLPLSTRIDLALTGPQVTIENARLTGERTDLTYRGRVTLSPMPGQARVSARLQGVDAEEAVSRLFDVGKAGLGAAASGEVSVEWPRGRRRALSGRAALDLEPREDGRTPLGGRFVWRAHEGAQVVEQGEFVTPLAPARVRGHIAAYRRREMAWVTWRTAHATLHKLSHVPL